MTIFSYTSSLLIQDVLKRNKRMQLQQSSKLWKILKTTAFSHRLSLLFFAVLTLSTFFISHHLQSTLLETYKTQESSIFYDRTGNVIAIQKNSNGYYSFFQSSPPQKFEKLLLKKEDQYFFLHLGVNPWSSLQAAIYRIGIGERKAASTITQQLTKILLGNESQRTLKNKFIETVYAISLELHQSKKEILRMYTNSVYFGNQTQGLFEASHFYFGVDPELLGETQILQLLSTINSPTHNNPLKSSNKESALLLANNYNIQSKNVSLFLDASEVQKNVTKHIRKTPAFFELSSFLNNPRGACTTTLDLNLMEKIREIVSERMIELRSKNAHNAAVVVLKLPENEVLAIIGSPDPQSLQNGSQINMAIEPRQIGSTIKPFIYVKAFEKGARPYTLVNDREYKYITALGFPLYPKNYDYTYRGEVTLHYALSNSLNVPAVKVLEYVGLDNFYSFLLDQLNFVPIQNIENYQLGIALGTLEMSLFDLSRYFTIFGNNGKLTETKLFQKGSCRKKSTEQEIQIAHPQYIQLVNKILNDRKTGVEQFRRKSELNLFQDNYALKTGTSRDFVDSWVIGYTPDFLVGVWVGNADATPTKELSGQLGAGTIWSKTMELLLNSSYNKKTPFLFEAINEFKQGEHVEYGLLDDDYNYYQTILLEQDLSIILNPHDGDTFLFQEGIEIPLRAKGNVQWFVNGTFWGEDASLYFSPNSQGSYTISAQDNSGATERIKIFVQGNSFR